VEPVISALYDAAPVSRTIPYPKPPLSTDDLVLRRFRRDDFALAQANDTDPSTARWLNPLPASTGEEVVRFNEWARRQGNTLVLTIADKESDAYLGEILLFSRQWQVAELAYLVLPSARGRGLAPTAVRLMSTWAFDRLGAQRLQLMVAVENESSHRVAEKNGYRREGVLRSAYEVRGARADMVMYSRLPGDPAFA